MTATRWWVKTAARWLARFDGVSGQVKMGSLAVTAFSTFSIMLQNFGLGHFVPYIGVAAFVFFIVYTYYFTEGGVWNQMARDRVDLSTNYAGPTMRMDDELIGLAVFAAVHERPPTDDERQAISEAVDGGWHDYRDGLSEEYFSDDD